MNQRIRDCKGATRTSRRDPVGLEPTVGGLQAAGVLDALLWGRGPVESVTAKFLTGMAAVLHLFRCTRLSLNPTSSREVCAGHGRSERL
jgi:hypothetical protein